MISVIIPTYNEREDLIEAIASLDNQIYRDLEIIVIDDGSKDGTLRALKDIKLKTAHLKFARQNHLGAGAARNYGANLAKGEILVFVDADMTFDPNFLKNLVKPIEAGVSRGTFSKEEYVANWNNIWSRCWNINEGWEPKRRHGKNYPDKQFVFRAILKREFDKVGGFTPGGYDDDWSLARKLNYMATAAQDAIFYHKNPASLSEVFKHARWVGKRKYKFGKLGAIITLFRSSLPMSVVVGIIKAIKSYTPEFLIFKTVYDMGIFLGIMELLVSNKSSK